MGERGHVVIRYSATGADQVVRKDRQVRESQNKTAKGAKKNTGVIENWLKANKAALLGISVAAAGTMAIILGSSTIATAGIDGIRMAFSLLADSIFQHLEPALLFIEDKVNKLDTAFNKLPEPIQSGIAWFLFAAVALAILAGGLLGVVAFASVAGVALAPLVAVFGVLALAVGFVAAVLESSMPIWAKVLSIIVIVGGAVLALWAIFSKGAILVAVFKAVAAGVVALAAAVGAPVWVVIAAIVALIAIGLLLIKHWDDVVAWTKRAWQDIVHWVKKAVHDIGAFFGGIGSTIAGVIKSAYTWGRDLLIKFGEGMVAAYAWVEAKAKGAYDKIAGWLSFDMEVNDRMAMKWGQDFGAFWAAGLVAAMPALDGAAGRFQAQAPVAAGAGFGAGGAAGGTSIHVTIESGAIQYLGAEARGIDEDRLAERIGRHLGDRVGWRGR